MNSVQIIITSTLIISFHLCHAQVGCQGRTGLFVADPNNQPSPVYLQCIKGQLFVLFWITHPTNYSSKSYTMSTIEYLIRQYNNILLL